MTKIITKSEFPNSKIPQKLQQMPCFDLNKKKMILLDSYSKAIYPWDLSHHWQMEVVEF